RALADPAIRVAAYDESQPGLRRFFAQLATYLGLVGLASLLVGGVGIASSVTTFLRRQLGTIAILKYLGAGWRTLLVTYLLQTLAAGLGGSLAGAALAALGILLGLSRGLMSLARRLPRLPGLAWRQGLAGLGRPGGHTVRVVVALGVGVMLLVAVALLEASLGRQLAYEGKREAPT